MKLKIIPAFQVLVFAGIAYAIQMLLNKPLFIFSFPAMIPLLILSVGVLVLLISGNLFRREKTTITPRQPDKATKLVTHGLYQYSRNPMYVGFMLILLAWCLYMDNLLTLLLPVLFIISMNMLQIQHEEKALENLFGDEYRQYCQQVRRWI